MQVIRHEAVGQNVDLILLRLLTENSNTGIGKCRIDKHRVSVSRGDGDRCAGARCLIARLV